MPAVCLGGATLQRLAPGARIVRVPRVVCNERKYCYVEGVSELAYQVRIHNSCVCNELIALHNRHLIDRTTIDFDPFRVRTNFEIFMDDIKLLIVPTYTTTYYNIWRNYSGAKRAVYRRAAENLLSGGFHYYHARVRMFVKPDKYPAAEIGVKAPRAIQFRSPEFNLMLAKFLKPIEEYLYALPEKIFAKGYSNVERGAILKEKWEMFADPVAILIDHSKFDSSITPILLNMLHKFYLKFNPSRTLKRLLKYQLRNVGYTRGGIKYIVKGTGMSGDFDTALKNCILNWFVLQRVFRDQAEYFIDGDDAVVILERRAWGRCKRRLSFFSVAGLVTKVQCVGSFNQIKFCQLSMLDSGVMVRDPQRAISHFLVTLKQYVGPARMKYLRGKVLGLFHSTQRSPILYYLFKELSTFWPGRVLLDDDIRRLVELNPLVGGPTEEDRIAYYGVFGFSIDEQLRLERELPKQILRGGLFSDISAVHHEGLYYAQPENAASYQE